MGVTYFYAEKDLSSLAQELIALDMEGYKTFRVNWSVSESSADVDGIQAKY